MVGNQHGVSFSRQVGIKANSGFEEDESPPVLEGSQVCARTTRFNSCGSGSQAYESDKIFAFVEGTVTSA